MVIFLKIKTKLFKICIIRSVDVCTYFKTENIYITNHSTFFLLCT